ncbi:hypothetical protein [Phenylobacterium sp.]|uniref:hypothetical protein n=1 Tax=Phenylobacterium sp. TaxID=1871053 RepID=UPI002BBBEB89|nr:hypothetical protein [Phenylobacterium sp.]HLZ75707.1 hypothetical protein [Phenylobacterium sp.]
MAADYEIEFEEPEFRKCTCCGRTLTSLTRFVHRRGDAFAVYYLDLNHADQRPIAYGLVGFGDWGADNIDPVAARTAFAFQLALGAEAYALGMIDPDETPWTTTFLGRRLTREEALRHPLLQEVFDLSDHMVQCDERLIAHLGRGAET